MLSRMIGAARLSVETYEDVEHDSSATIQALAVVIIVSIAAFVGGLIADEDTEVLNALVFGLVGGVVGWALWALFTYMIGSTILKTEDTEADWGQLARGTGFAQTPGLLHVFIFVPAVGWIISLVGLAWTIAAMVVAVRQSLDYTSTLRAIVVILIAFIPVAIVWVIVMSLTGLALGEGGETS